jgi:ClpP class serine protease
MSDWNTILNEINVGDAHDAARLKYVSKFAEIRQRNCIFYYSGWLQKNDPRFHNVVSITDDDKAGFMNCFKGMDWSKGLDLVLRSPGGFISATESIIHYVRSKFADDLSVFVPQIAMSGGTIMALAGKEIWLGHQSNLGPIDPQFGSKKGVS